MAKLIPVRSATMREISRRQAAPLSIVLSVVSLLVLPRAASTDSPAKSQPTTRASSVSGDTVAQGLAEGGVQFNSKLGLEIWVCDESGVKKAIGRTPRAAPLKIPKCRWWVVQPLAGTSLADVVAEGNRTGIRGLKLERASDGDLAKVGKWSKLQRLLAWISPITDAGVGHLKDMKELKKLDLSRTKISDAGLAAIKDLKGLQELDLSQTPITDAGLACLKNMKGLRRLDLATNQITDAGLVHIGELKKLQTLNLGGTKITDAGLVNLGELKGLRKLEVWTTKVTNAGVQELRKVLIKTDIDND